jgi:hypothetical protein
MGSDSFVGEPVIKSVNFFIQQNWQTYYFTVPVPIFVVTYSPYQAGCGRSESKVCSILVPDRVEHKKYSVLFRK